MNDLDTTPAAFLYLFGPYYDDGTRPCSYYEVDERETGATVRLRVVSWEEAHR
jgi:hypothetical protein